MLKIVLCRVKRLMLPNLLRKHVVCIERRSRNHIPALTQMMIGSGVDELCDQRPYVVGKRNMQQVSIQNIM